MKPFSSPLHLRPSWPALALPRRSSVRANLSLALLAAQIVAGCSGPAGPATSTTMDAATQVGAATAVGAASSTPRLAIQPPTATLNALERVELTVTTDALFKNPFDPAQADLQVRFTPAQGDGVRVPAFWYQAYDPATLRPVGAPGWRVRFTPPTAGRWQARASLQPAGLISTPITFEVGPARDPRGFVRVNAANPHYFSFADGQLFFPIGLNLAWAKSLAQTGPQYTRWLGQLSANGGNLARVWMPDWGVGLEWKDTGLGDYTGRLQQAWLLDEVFTLAEKDDVYLLLTLLNHGAFSETVNPEWADNPYNAANGGPLTTPGDFVSDPAAKDFFKRRLRYIAARWGYSPHLFAWEWWNEVNWTPIDDARLGPWITEMTQALRQFDPNPHLISTSYSGGSASKLWAQPELSFMQQHDYSGNDPVIAFSASYDGFMATAPDKPVLMGEHGYSPAGADPPEREAIHFHNGLWAAPFTGYAGTALAWWWDDFVDPQNLWPEYRRVADFLRGEDLTALKPGRGTASLEVYALTLHSATRALVWVRSRAFDAKAATPPAPYAPPVLHGRTLEVPGLRDGAYRADWFDPQTGQWLAPASARSADGVLDLPLPDFSRDLAVKLVDPAEPRPADGP